MKKLNLWLIAITATSIVSVTAVAQTTASNAESREHHHAWSEGNEKRGGFHHKHMHKNHFPLGKGLDLTDAQKKTLADVRQEQEPKLKELREKMRTAHEALDKAADNNADDAMLSRLANDLAVVIAQQELSRIKIHQQFVSILTPEQKQKLDSLKAEHKKGFRWKDKEQKSTETKK